MREKVMTFEEYAAKNNFAIETVIGTNKFMARVNARYLVSQEDDDEWDSDYEYDTTDREYATLFVEEKDAENALRGYYEEQCENKKLVTKVIRTW